MPQEPEKSEKCEVGGERAVYSMGGVMCIGQGGSSRL